MCDVSHDRDDDGHFGMIDILCCFCKDDVDFLQLMINAEVDDKENSNKGETWTKSRGYYFKL